MKRFFRSALFPILIVIVLAFFAQRLINTGDQEEQPTYNEFIAQIENEPATIEKLTFDQKSHTVEVVEKDQTEYSTGYLPEQEARLINIAERNEIETRIEGTGGGGFLSFLTYLLPFILIFGFWFFLLNQMQGGG